MSISLSSWIQNFLLALVYKMWQPTGIVSMEFTKKTRRLTYKGPISNLWARGARMNHIIMAAHILILREKIAINNISTRETRIIRIFPS